MKAEKSIYFPGLNGLRFFAALAVIITHIELMKKVFDYENYWRNPVINILGGFGVYFFFVLSGFLITFLLLSEKEKQGMIHIKQFYIRRILKIWPLYYLILVLGFFFLPKIDLIKLPTYQEEFSEHFNVNFLLYLFILPNLAFSLYKSVPHIGQTWSIGVEEQFYIFWPWVISKSKNILKSLLVIIVALVLLKIVVLILGKFYSATSWYLPLTRFVVMSKFECMALGGMGAYLVFSKHRLLSLLYNKYVLNFSLFAIPVLIYATPENLQDGIHIIYSLIFLIIIVNVANQSVKIKLENKILNYLGKISYGIYMYHLMIVALIIQLCVKYIPTDSELLLNIIIYSASILATIAVSGISFWLFENRFIKLKSKFSFIKSGSKEPERL